jgi:hypothetical protein
MKKSEVLAIRIDSDILDYVRVLANSESRSIAKQISHMILSHKMRAETMKLLRTKEGNMPKGRQQ